MIGRKIVNKINVSFTETPYGRIIRRSRYKPQPSSSFSEKDEDLAEKIRTYRENVRRKARESNDDDFTFRRENVFDFDAWYRAHFLDDFDTKIRDERKIKYAQQYAEQMRRMEQGYRIRPPRPYVERKEMSAIELQTIEMVREELKQKLKNILYMATICIVGMILTVYIVEKSLNDTFEECRELNNQKPSAKLNEE